MPRELRSPEIMTTLPTMLSDDEILRLMRERVNHPATAKELVQFLKIGPRRAARVQAAPAGARGVRRARRDPRPALRPARPHEPRSSAASRPIRAASRSSIPKCRRPTCPRASTSPATTSIRPCTAIASSCASSTSTADRAEGRIVRILERAAKQIVGRYELDAGGQGFVVPFDRRLTMDVQVPRGEARDAASGEMVTVEITRFPTPTRPALGRIIEVLGAHRRAGRRYRRHHPQVQPRGRALRGGHRRSAGGSAPPVREKDLQGRTDFRQWPTVTIDGETARDFDDAISIDRLPNGNFWLGVHIADVSHYVTEGSALDAEAYERATSVYFPERAVHMFPSELSTGLCSLNPHVDRLVQSCLMEVDRQHRRRRPLRNARRGDPQRRADDLHRRSTRF